MTALHVRSRWVRIALVVAGSALSCGGSTESDESGTAGSGGVAAAGGSGGSTPGGTGGSVGGSGGVSPVVVLCDGVECAAGEECCLTDSKCFDPAANPGACVAPTQPGPQGETPCAASSQCPPGEYCQPNGSLCLGPGYCASLTNCPSSSPPEAWCGCNGVTYPNLQTACAAGVKIIGKAACGDPVTVGAAGGSAGKKVTFCATDAHCASGEKCCGITGLCYDSTQPVLCSFPPSGTSLPCIDDTQCIQGVEYCKGEGCTEPGGCAGIPGSGSCTGELDPVCGCNGKTYTNEVCAATAGVRVAHAGQCP